MADKSDTGGQPTIEKLASEGVSIRKCISYEGLGEYGGGGGSSKPASNQGSKPKGVLASVGKSRSGY